MRTLNIVAKLTLGVFYGHTRDKRPDRHPDYARLHAALIHAASQGSYAEEVNGRLEPSESSLAALRWLDHHPPTGIQLPQSCWVSPNSHRFTHREVSSINKNHRTEQRAVSDGVAVCGEYGWQWLEVPPQVADVVERLLEDISCLGEAHSIAVVELGEVKPTLLLDTAATPFTPGGTLVRVPTAGRTEYLISEYRRANPNKFPTVSKDKMKVTELPSPPPSPNKYLREVKYKPIDARPIAAPWNQVVLFELSGDPLGDQQRVAACVAMHRALVSAIGFGAPSLVTGHYGSSAQQPTNRLAIQYLEAEHVVRFGLQRHAIALLLPRDATDVELRQLVAGLTSVHKIWSREMGRRKLYFNGVVVPADEFWPEPEPGTVRFWAPATAVIPETRPLKSSKQHPWSLADAGLLSLAFVWRDECKLVGKGQQLYRSLRDQIAARGAFVHDARTLPVPAASYVHRMHKSLTAQPWSGLLYLGDLMGKSTIVAVGQSRHLGGGLLIPRDIPEDLALKIFALNKEYSNVAN